MLTSVTAPESHECHITVPDPPLTRLKDLLALCGCLQDLRRYLVLCSHQRESSVFFSIQRDILKSGSEGFWANPLGSEYGFSGCYFDYNPLMLFHFVSLGALVFLKCSVIFSRMMFQLCFFKPRWFTFILHLAKKIYLNIRISLKAVNP